MRILNRSVSPSIMRDVGLVNAEHPAIVEFARINGISLSTVRSTVDKIFSLCESRGVSPTTDAVIDALRILAAFHDAGAELRQEITI